MKTLKFNKLKISAFKDSVQRKVKMFPIHKSIVKSLAVPLRQILYLSMGRIRHLTNRTKVTLSFLELVLALKKNHGSNFTIKWLKACYVALQKALGDDLLHSLRDLEPDLPLPRLINGIPAIIKSRDRQLIRDGDKRTIIFWSSLFSIYRVLKCTYKLKTSTITDPFTGDKPWMDELLSLETFRPYFNDLKGFSGVLKNSNLAPRRIRLLRTASPTNRVSWHGLLTDATLLGSDNEMYSNFMTYLDSVKSYGWKTMWFEEKLKEMMELGNNLINDPLNPAFHLKAKCSLSGEFGQFSLKEEAAGKLRIFAIVDSLSQTLLSPMHDFMFSTLRLIPNDGTFDQEASIKRSQSKAVDSGNAYSFDLSAATDRLPVVLTEKILSVIFTKELAGAWKKLMVNRDFHFSLKAISDYDAPTGPVRYSVGQPMGALSSWPALALTHHWILQHCSKLLGRTGWEEQYEILGDDLVIFDAFLAEKYLDLTSKLGVEINLNKSISSAKKPVFEFAKKTCMGFIDVSPIPFKQLLSNTSLSERTSNLVSLMKRELITSRSLIGVALSKFGSWRILLKKEEFKTPLLAILGVLHSMNIIPHRWLVEALIDPNSDLDELVGFSLPQESVLKLIKECSAVLEGKATCIPNFYSKLEDRDEIYDDYEPEFANVIANSAYTRAKALERDLPSLVSTEAKNLYLDNDVTSVSPLLKTQIEAWFDDLLYEDGKFDVMELVDSIEKNKKFYYRRLDIESALSIEEQVSRFEFNYTLTPKKFEEVKVESAPIIKIISKILSSKTSGYLSINRPD